MQRRLRVCCEFPPRHSLGEPSSNITFAPSSRARKAAHKAALPPPITSTSITLSPTDSNDFFLILLIANLRWHSFSAATSFQLHFSTMPQYEKFHERTFH